MKTMARRLLSLLLFCSLAVVWADPLPIPDYEETLPRRESACWISIKMFKMTVPIEWAHQKEPFMIYKDQPFMLYKEPEDSEELFDKITREKLIEKAGIDAFKRMNCYAAPSKSEDLNKCQEIAVDACSSKKYNSVTLIYEIQERQKQSLHRSLLRLSQKAIEDKKEQRFETVLFIDCQTPTDMDMKDNPTGCQGGIRLDFDPTFSKHFPRSQIEIRSFGSLLDDRKFRRIKVVAREKVKGNFLMTLNDDISSRCNALRGLKYIYPNNEVRAIKATNEGIVLFDANYNKLTERVRSCVLKNTLLRRDDPARSLQIHRRKGNIKEILEQKLEPQETMIVQFLAHTEIYPFFSVPEPLVKESSGKPLYVHHLKVMMNKQHNEGHEAVEVKTESLKHENWRLKTVTCWANEENNAAENCSYELYHIADGHQVFVSCGDREVLTHLIRFLVFPPLDFQPENNWKPYFEKTRAKFKFIKVGEWLTESEIPDPELLPRSPFYNTQIETQPSPGFTKGELHLDVALYQAYRPLQASYAAIEIGSSAVQIACFDSFMGIKFSGDKYKLYTRKRMEKGIDDLNNQQGDKFPNTMIKIKHRLLQFPILSYILDGKKIKKELPNVSEMTLTPIDQLEDKESSPNLSITCSDWLPVQENKRTTIDLKNQNVNITFFEIDLRSTVIFPPIQTQGYLPPKHTAKIEEGELSNNMQRRRNRDRGGGRFY